MNENDEIFGHLPQLNYSVKEEEFDTDSSKTLVNSFLIYIRSLAWFNMFMDEANDDFDSTKLHELVVEYLVFSGYKEAGKY